jgi:hypothetical protein
MSIKRSKIMANFTVSKLFPDEDGTTRRIGTGKLNVNTLFKNKLEEDTNKIFDSKTLLTQEKGRKKVVHSYNMNMFNVCCDKIKSANSCGVKDIVFEVMNFIPECPEYKPEKCLVFISEKLDEQHIGTVILSDTKIFITWKNLEEKIRQAELDNV